MRAATYGGAWEATISYPTQWESPDGPASPHVIA